MHLPRQFLDNLYKEFDFWTANRAEIHQANTSISYFWHESISQKAIKRNTCEKLKTNFISRLFA